jgi:single-stranded DNA-binding protein
MIMNKVILGGMIGSIKTETTKGGAEVIRIRLAEKVVRNNEKTTQWHNVSGFKKVRELLEKHFSVGDYLSFVGRLEVLTWESNGSPRSKTEVLVQEIDWDGCRNGRNSNDSRATSSPNNQNDASAQPGQDGTGGPNEPKLYRSEDFDDDRPL